MSSQLTIYAVPKGQKVCYKKENTWEMPSGSFLITWLCTTPTRDLQRDGIIDYTIKRYINEDYDPNENYVPFTKSICESIINYYSKRYDLYTKQIVEAESHIKDYKENLYKVANEELLEAFENKIEDTKNYIQETEQERLDAQSYKSMFLVALQQMDDNKDNFDFYYEAD